ncbi:MAG: hypothetical protein ACI8ZF_000204 [Candidatus Midichloriaceae bacterium]|jgi:hypothetical protein
MSSLIFDELNSVFGKFTNKLFSPQFHKSLNSKNISVSYDKEKLEKINLQTAKYGEEIPIIYGNVRISGNIIWSSGLQKTKSEANVNRGNSKNNLDHNTNEYKYSISLAIAICEGEINDIIRIWINDELIDLNDYKIKIYKGTNTQNPDPTISAKEGENKTPGYRGLAYIVVTNLQIEKFQNKIPKFSFEIYRNKISTKEKLLKEKINSIIMLPGSGEFVYDTIIQKKISHNTDTNTKEETLINHNTEENKADCLVSLDQLKNNLPNLEWVAPVINWYATDLDAAKCSILPGVEFKCEHTKTHPDIWKVGDFSRENAHAIKQKNDTSIYGGTINDASIVRYLKELKDRGYKVMFYPMVLVDNFEKTWRGRITGSTSEDIQGFFNNKNGYKSFIIHYAKLVCEFVDAFIIGSELIGLTKFKDGNIFPAVEELSDLATELRPILGANVKISYGADWSEYHHADGGWFNMDKLWSNPNIDFIGIDAYFPLTNNNYTSSVEEVIHGWESGECYDYYLDHEKQKQRLDPKYALKNIKLWWENEHINPDNKKTNWIPKSKKIWFTEIGFPSIDCATNEPNVFFDPNTIESKVPKHSKGKIDFHSQKIGLKAAEDQWKNSEIVENKFIWAWDARPFPYWPDKSHVWNDSACWYTGHWIQGKLSSITLNQIIYDLCLKSGIKSEQIDIKNLSEEIIGYYFIQDIPPITTIRILSKLYNFDIIENGNQIIFQRTNDGERYIIHENDIILNSKSQSGFIIEINNKDDLVSKLYFSYLSHEHSFNISNICIQKSDQSSVSDEISIPIVLQETQAQKAANNFMHNITKNKIFYKFSLPYKYINIKIGDFIEISKIKLSVFDVEITNNYYINIIGVSI